MIRTDILLDLLNYVAKLAKNRHLTQYFSLNTFKNTRYFAHSVTLSHLRPSSIIGHNIEIDGYTGTN